MSGERGQLLDDLGVPRPDGTVLGDARHVLRILQDRPDEEVIYVATRNIYGPEVETGLSLGDLRALYRAAAHWHRLRESLHEDFL